ncbi:MAG: thioredoxin domain-containing protein [Planctomycetota bacterium]|jgi:hypothetical protein
MNQVGHLEELNKKYYERGLRIIAVSAEPIGLLQAQVVEGRGGNYWIASDPDRATVSGYTQPGRRGIPHAYLIDATGTVVGEGVPDNGKIEQLLEGVFDASLGRELHKSLKAAVKSYEKGDYGKAYAAAAKFVDNEDRVISSDAKFLQERSTACANFAMGLVKKGIEQKDFTTVYDDLKRISKQFAGMEVAHWGGEKKKELDGSDEVKTEMKAWKALKKAQSKQAAAKGKAKKLGPAKKAYKSIVKKYPGTRAAKMAEEALRSLPQ